MDAQPDALYLVGRIAPAKLRGKGGITLAEDADEQPDSDVVPAEAADLGRGVPVGVRDEETAGAEDEGTEDGPLRRRSMIPGSMGPRFHVALGHESVVVCSSRGTTWADEGADE